MAQSVELLLKIKDVIALLFHLAVIFVVDCIHNLLHFELVTHLRLGSSSFATSLEDVDTSTLGRWQNIHQTMLEVGDLVCES